MKPIFNKGKPGYQKNHIPINAAYCVYCHGSGCDKCGGKGFYFPDIEHPIRSGPKWG